MVRRKFIRFFLERSPWLKSYPHWIDPFTMREQLRFLLSELRTPDLCLILDANADGSYSWKRFGRRTKAQKWKRYVSIEETVVNNYLAYLAQMCQSEVFTASGSFVAFDARYVLCPEAFLNYVEYPNNGTISLEKIIEKASVVCLEPGEWRNRCKVLQWQACLAVWRKHGKQLEAISMRAVEQPHGNLSPPPAYSEPDQIPPYSEKAMPDISQQNMSLPNRR